MFFFPESLGQLAGLPLPVPRLYTWYIGLLILVFAGAYVWLARGPELDRPLVLVAAVLKAAFFAMAALCWYRGEASGSLVGVATIDLAFAAIFIWWLLSERRC